MLFYKNYVTKKRNEQPFPARGLYSAQNPFLELLLFDIMGIVKENISKEKIITKSAQLKRRM